MKKYVWAGALCLSQLLAFAALPSGMMQNKTSLPAVHESGWKAEYRDSELLIESSVIIVDDQSAGTKHERVIFRYTNLTAKQLVVSFDRTLYYDGICYGCDKKDKKYTVELAPSQTKEYSKENKDKTYYIFSKDIKKTIQKKLDNYQILNIEKQVK